MTEGRYDLVVSARVIRQLRSLPEKVAAAVVEFVKGPLREHPARVGKPLREPFAGQRSARRGDYRVRYHLDEDARTVTVVDVSHRGDAYRSR